MNVMHELTPAPPLMTGEMQEKVREQLNRMLETHHFRNSRRYPALLRFIVEEALEGRGEFLKERLLGIRVFDRPADYDTATDPVVRVTIAEIRKRIAQYYHDEEHDAEIRIELLPGRYAPEFRTRVARKEAPPEHAFIAELDEAEALALTRLHEPPQPLVAAAVSSPQTSLRWARLALASAAILILGIFSPRILDWLRPSALDQLWAPVFATQRTVLFCLPTDVGKKHNQEGEIIDEPDVNARKTNPHIPNGQTFLAYEALGENVVYSDMMATLKVAGVLALARRDYRVKLNVNTNLEDLREGPSIVIGGLDNQWTMRALNPLRFHFSGTDEDRFWIGDSQNPSDHSLSLDNKREYASITRDYAIIARLHNDQTGQPEMIVAGIGMSGTSAAGEFIADEARVRELRERIGPRFKDHDFEAVLSTDVINGSAGAPKIVAVAVW